jgi:hypothetical protein
MSYPPSPARLARDDGIRRLSRLTWRVTQLSAIATVAFATLFARAAGANTTTASKALAEPAAQPAQPWSQITIGKPVQFCPARKRPHRPRHRHHTAVPAPATTAPAPPPAPAPAPTLTPPPAPPAPTPTPAQTSSSGSHGGG